MFELIEIQMKYFLQKINLSMDMNNTGALCAHHIIQCNEDSNKKINVKFSIMLFGQIDWQQSG